MNHLARSLLRLLWRLFIALFNTVLVILVVVVLVGAWVYYHYGHNLPDPKELEQHRSFETTRIYARDGQTLLYELVDPQGGHRTSVEFDRIPQIVKDATIAVEDANFYEHAGVDVRGVLRALWLNYQHQQIVSGGSTITQQLVRNVLLPEEERGRDMPESQLYERKLRESILAFRVSQVYSKDDILHLYLNQVYYGAQAYGIEAAAYAYFNKHVWELSEGEATLLAGLPQSPTRMNPFVNMEGAKARQRITIDLMVKNGYLSPKQGEQIFAEPITLQTPTTNIIAPHFVFYVRDMLEKQYGPDIVYRGGLRVVTSLDVQWQTQAEQIAQQRIAELQQRNAHNAAVVMLSPEGEILAMVGSIDYNNSAIGGQVNVATSPRQPGSALKPIVYVAAMQKGWTPATIIWDEYTEFDRPGGGAYIPLNYDNSWHGAQSLRMALANSLNIPAVKALEFAGISSFVHIAIQMGITTFTDSSRYSLAMALGSNEVRLLDLSVAYNTFRSGGYYHPPLAILKVETNSGEVLVKPEETGWKRQVLGKRGEELAFLITDILSDDEARWYMFGRGNVMELPNGIDAAVKTGTSNEWRDSWAVGYTPEVTVGVWVGNNDNTPMHEIAGANGAGTIWRDMMVAFHENRVAQPFAIPKGIVQKEICVGTGTLAHETCPVIAKEYFASGIEPPPLKVTYQKLKVAGDGSCLAASYSQPDEVRLVEFAAYPARFREWAQQHGVPQPPTEPCPPSQAPNQAVALLMPVSSTGFVESDQVLVYGTARFGYSLEFGTGRSPKGWSLLAEGSGGVENGVLGLWETDNLADGEYTLRLMVTTPEGYTMEATQVVWIK